MENVCNVRIKTLQGGPLRAFYFRGGGLDAAVEEGRVSRSEVTVPLCGCFPGCGQCFSMPHLGFHTSKCQGFDAKQNCEGVKLY